MLKSLFQSKLSLLALALITIALISGNQVLLRGKRLDLTEGKLYTLSRGTTELLQALPAPLHLEFFFSEGKTQNAPQLRAYASRIRELLQEYVARAQGQLTLSETDPEPFSIDEDRAAALGLQPARVGGDGDDIYLGLHIFGDATHQQSIGFFHPNREAQIEYDVSQAIYLAGRDQAPRIGLMSSLPVNGGADAFGRPQPAWQSIAQLQQLNTLVEIPIEATQIPEDLDLLIVLHPKSIGEQAQYAIDQYLLSGGNAIISVDPYAEGDQTASLSGQASRSDLPKLLAHWGVHYSPEQILGDRDRALAISRPDSQRAERLPSLFGLLAEDWAHTRMLERLQSLNFSSAGAFGLTPDSPSGLAPKILLQSSQNSALMDANLVDPDSDPKDQYSALAEASGPLNIAVQLTGVPSSAFADGPPVAIANTPDSDSDSDSDSGTDTEAEADADTPPATAETAEESPPHKALGSQPIVILLIADSDVFSDRLWVQVADFFGQPIASPFADNGQLLSNAAAILAGDINLLDVRNQGAYARPFTLVAELERQAEQQFRVKEQELLARLSDTEQKLNALQSSNADAQALVLSPEQQETLAQFQQEKLRIRQELRQVQHQLGARIERLGTRLKLWHIVGIPLFVVGLFWLVSFSLRYRKKLSIS